MSTEKNCQALAPFSTSTTTIDGADIVFECNGKHIAVSIFPSHSSQDCHKSQHEHSIEDHLIDLLGQAVDDNNNHDDIVEDISDAIFDTGRPLFAQVVQEPPRSPSNQVLHSLLYPQTFHFRLQTIDSKPAIVPIDPNEAYTNSDPHLILILIPPYRLRSTFHSTLLWRSASYRLFRQAVLSAECWSTAGKCYARLGGQDCRIRT